ncbi:MAG TPA: YetF domain-containing protein [Bacteriovoracaceae bacterium]|nr:YetF domain-containing protein [Bacteriovoracaceae bacterium]
MWELTVPWYDIVIRSSLIYLLFFILFRVIGKKHTGDLSRFDLILLLVISELVESAIIQNDKSITAVAIGATTLILLSVILDKLAFRSQKIEMILNGSPILLIKNGDLCKEELKKEEISEIELKEALRMNGINDIKQVEYATLETNGKISVIEKKASENNS